MQQFVLVPAFVYNYSLKNQSVTKQKLPKYQPLQNPTFQFVSNKEEINKKLLAKANPFVLSMYQALRLGNFNFEWCRNWNWTVRLCSTTALWKCRLPNIYFPLLDVAGLSPTLNLSQNAKSRERERERERERVSWILHKNWTSEAAGANMVHGGAANGSLCNLVKASNLSAA